MDAHAVLGLQANASKEQVKEAFRKLVWQYHPDKCAPADRAAAEAKFKEVKHAYESILQRHAGYRPPPPGSAPNMQSAETYWHAHSTDGRVPWGKYAGWETEMAFYRAMLRGGRNNMAILAVLGLMAIPTAAAGVAILQSWQQEECDDDAMERGGLDSLRPDAYVVNGALTQHNPWAASGTDAMWRYREVQAARAAARDAAAGSGGSGGSGSGASSPSSSRSSNSSSSSGGGGARKGP